MINIKLPLIKKTKRLIVRPLEMHDYENWRQAYTLMKPAQNEWDEGPWAESELTKKKFNELLKSQNKLARQDHFYEFAVFRRDDGVMVGQVSLMDVSRKVFQNAYLGYRIFNTYWGQGFAQESCRAALEIAFDNLGLHRLEAGIAPTNKKSVRVAKGIGLRKEGLSKKRLCINGKWIDLLIYAGTCEDFGIKFKKRRLLRDK